MSTLILLLVLAAPFVGVGAIVAFMIATIGTERPRS